MVPETLQKSNNHKEAMFNIAEIKNSVHSKVHMIDSNSSMKNGYSVLRGIPTIPTPPLHTSKCQLQYSRALWPESPTELKVLVRSPLSSYEYQTKIDGHCILLCQDPPPTNPKFVVSNKKPRTVKSDDIVSLNKRTIVLTGFHRTSRPVLLVLYIGVYYNFVLEEERKRGREDGWKRLFYNRLLSESSVQLINSLMKVAFLCSFTIHPFL